MCAQPMRGLLRLRKMWPVSGRWGQTPKAGRHGRDRKQRRVFFVSPLTFNSKGGAESQRSSKCFSRSVIPARLFLLLVLLLRVHSSTYESVATAGKGVLNELKG